MLRWSCLITAYFTTLLFPVLALADPIVLPCGEVIYDSTFITINASDSETVVDVLVKSAVLKLVSDDYLLSFERTTTEGAIRNGEFEVDVGDTVTDLSWRRDWLRFSYLSQTLLEDTLRASVWTRTHYPPIGGERGMRSVQIRQYYGQSREWDDIWGSAGGSAYDRIPSYVLIRSSRQFDARCDVGRGYSEFFRGDSISFNSPPDNWVNWATLAIQIVLDSSGTVNEELDDDVSYYLSAETREAVPNIVIEESVFTTLHSSPQVPTRIVGYNLYSEIQLEPDLAGQIAPMWLWFPNDQIGCVSVILQGTIDDEHGNEWWYSDSLDIRRTEGNGQHGFYIHVPTLLNQDVNFHTHFSDPWLIVTISDESFRDSARFILVTAPMDPSIVRFTIPAGLEFVEWSSPFDGVERGFTQGRPYLVFTGICAEPGIARVVWRPAESAELREAVPTKFAIESLAPNPFNSRTTLKYSLPVNSAVRLKIRDATGREMWSEEVNGDAGENLVSIDADALPAGVYFLEAVAAGNVQRVKIVALK